METKKKKYLAPSQIVIEVDDSQLLLMTSEPGTSTDHGTSSARRNNVGWDGEDY